MSILRIEHYKGLTISENIGGRFSDSKYWTVCNENIKLPDGRGGFHSPHAHIQSLSNARLVCDIYNELKKYGFSTCKNRIARNKAMMLDNIKVRY